MTTAGVVPAAGGVPTAQQWERLAQEMASSWPVPAGAGWPIAEALPLV
jgi:hypothetical protein